MAVCRWPRLPFRGTFPCSKGAGAVGASVAQSSLFFAAVASRVNGRCRTRGCVLDSLLRGVLALALHLLLGLVLKPRRSYVDSNR